MIAGDALDTYVTLKFKSVKDYTPKGVVAILKYEDGSYGLISRSGPANKASYSEQLFSANGIVIGKPVKLTTTQVLSKETSNVLDINGDGAIGDVVTLIFDSNGSINSSDKGLYKTTSGNIILASSHLSVGDSAATSTPLLATAIKAWAVPTGATVKGMTFTNGGSLEVLTVKGAQFSAQTFNADTALQQGKAAILKIDQVIAREYYYDLDLNNDGQVSLIGQETLPTSWPI